ncbi:MAG: ABC transporter permease subunit [Planctomycetota bacterium]|nr:ABC transporter permease subunit [Planctomycetota bacterium]
MPAALDRLLRLLPLNPVAIRLVEGGSRRLRHLYLRSGYLAAMMVLLLLALLGPSTSLRELAQRAASAFTLVSFGQVALICLLTPIFMAGAIAQEASPRTWDILLTTPLRPLQIVLGNLFGRLFFVLALLVSTLPLFVFTQAFGGVPGASIAASYAIAAVSALAVAAVAVTLAVTRTAGRRAVLVFYVTVMMVLALTYAGDLWLRQPVAVGSTTMRTTVLTPLNPFLALEAELLSNRYEAWDPATAPGGLLGRLWLGSPTACFIWLGVLSSTALAIFGSLRVRVIGERPLRSRRRGSWLGRPVEALRSRRRIGANPVAWRERTLRGLTVGGLFGRFAFALVGIAAALLLLLLHRQGTIDTYGLRLALVAAVGAEVFVIVLTALNLAATSVSREREDGSLDIILTTPIQPGPYLAGKLQGLVQILLPMMLVPVATLGLASLYVATGGFGGDVEVTVSDVVGVGAVTVPLVLPEAALELAVVLTGFVGFAVMVGLQWSIKSRGSIGAVVGAVGILIVIAGVLGLCGAGAGRSIPVVGAAMAALAPGNLVVAAVFPASAMPASIGDPGAARVALAVGSLISAGLWASLVYATHAHLKRTFMATVRQLAGMN